MFGPLAEIDALSQIKRAARVYQLYALRNAYFLLFSLMVGGYRDKRTRDFALGARVKAFSGIGRAARLKLDRLEAAVALSDLAALPGNRFEALKGDRKGQYSIRIND